MSRFVANLGEQLQKHMKGMKIYTRLQLYPVCMSLNGYKDSERDVGILKMVQRMEICQPLEIQKQMLKFVKLCPWIIG